jgi:hypothetical protein
MLKSFPISRFLHPNRLFNRQFMGPNAFTLVEALVTLSLLTFLLYTAGYFVSHVLLSSKISLKQKAIDDWGRIDFLLETDIREATAASIGSIPNNATCLSAPTGPALALIAPYDPSLPIVYYNSTVNSKPVVRRCGPDVLSDGSLSKTSSSDNILLVDAAISAQLTDNVLVDYQLKINTVDLTELGTARLRARSY